MVTLPTVGDVTRPLQQGYDASLGDLLLRFATAPDRQLQITTAPSQPERIQTQQTSEDFLSEFGQVFSRNNFIGGQGLDFAHGTDLDDIDTTRYWDSKGIDIAPQEPGELDGVELLPDTELEDATAETNVYLVTLPDGSLIYSRGNQVRETANPTVPTPSWNTVDPHTGTQDIEGLAVLGDEVYAACGTDGIGKRSAGGTWSDLASSTDAFGIWAVKGRIITDDGAGTVEINDLTTGAPTTLLNLDSGDSITDVADAGAAILISTSEGIVYSLTDVSGTLTLASQTRLNRSDRVQAMAWAAGVLVLGTWDGTRGRIWLASIGTNEQDYSISEAQLIKELSYPPAAALATRNRIYVMARESATEVALWRVQLESSGLARDLIFATANTDDPIGLARTNGILFATIGNEGLLRQTDTYVSEGYLISPMADFFSPSSKTWVGLTIQAENVGAGNTIEVYVATEPAVLTNKDDSRWQLVTRLVLDEQVGQEVVLPTTEGRYAAVQLRLQTTGATTPKLVSFALRAYVDSDDFIISMPVSVSDRVERPNRAPIYVRDLGLAIYSALLGYDGSYVQLDLFRPALSFRGVVEEIQTPIVGRSVRNSNTLFTLVQVRGRLVTSTSTTAETGSLGVEQLGIQQLGT